MPSSPRRQLENIIARNKESTSDVISARYVLDHPEWMALMRGRQSYFRDFVLDVVSYIHESDVDDAKVIAVLQDMCDSGYMWEAFNSLKQYLMPRSIAVSVKSLIENDVELTTEHVKSVHSLYSNLVIYKIGRPYVVSVEKATHNDFRMDALPTIDSRLVREVVNRPSSAHFLIGLMEDGYDSVDTVLELSNMAREQGAALRSGLL